MLDKRTFSTLAVVMVLAASALEAAPVGQDLPMHYLPMRLDGGLVQVDNPVDGRTWAAWAYRIGAEYDVAIASRDAGGAWSEPVFLGAGDGWNQIQPSLAVDQRGNLYLAFAVSGTGRIFVSTLPYGSQAWSTPVHANLDSGKGFAPALRVVGESLVLAFRQRGGITIATLPLIGPPNSGHGAQDGPDILPPNASPPRMPSPRR